MMVIDEIHRYRIYRPGDLISIKVNGELVECVVITAATYGNDSRAYTSASPVSPKPEIKAGKNQILNRLNSDLYEHWFKPAMINGLYAAIIKDGQPQTKAEKNQARLKHLRGRAGRWD